MIKIRPRGDPEPELELRGADAVPPGAAVDGDVQTGHVICTDSKELADRRVDASQARPNARCMTW